MLGIPIVMVMFGTAGSGLEARFQLDPQIRTYFPGSDIRWACAVTELDRPMAINGSLQLTLLHEAINELASEGYNWIVVQPILTTAGPEFNRLAEDIHKYPLLASLGLPLLSSAEDFQALVRTLGPTFLPDDDVATILLDQGPPKPNREFYSVLQSTFHQAGYHQVHINTALGAHAEQDRLIQTLRQDGIRMVHFVPLALYDRAPLSLDTFADPSSWKTAFLAAGMALITEDRGLLGYPTVAHTFIQHIAQAMNTIPVSAASLKNPVQRYDASFL